MPNSFTLQYLRPTVRARFLDVLLFLLSPSHEGAATKTMNKYDISIETGAKKTNKARERVKKQLYHRSFKMTFAFLLKALFWYV